MTVRPRIIYSRHYNISFLGLERLHPFDSRKYGRAYAVLSKRFGRALKQRTLRPKRPATREELLWVHTPAYLARLREPAYVAGALEVPQLSRVPAFLLDRIMPGRLAAQFRLGRALPEFASRRR